MYLNFRNIGIIFFILILLFWGCAKREAPEGGPKDNIPPKVIFSKPLTGQKNLGQNPEITIGFNERMKRLGIKTGITWRPLVKKFKTQWTENNLIVTPEDTLKANQTYVLTITGINDYHDVKMDSVFTLAFSTGSILDSCFVAGKIYNDDKPIASAIVRLYEKSDTTEVPAYFTSSRSTGEFSLDYIKNTEYRLLAFMDNNKDDEFDFGSEAGIDTTLIFLDKITKFKNFDLKLSITDTTPPFVQSAESIDNTHVQLKFSEIMTSDKIYRLKSYSITDSLNNPLEILSVMEGTEKDQSVIFRTAEQIDSLYYITTDSTLKDLSGHVINQKNRQKFIAKVYPDTIPPTVKTYYPENNALLDVIFPVLTINFGEFMSKESCEKAFSLMETAHNKKMDGKFKWQGETTMEFHLNQYLEWVVQYTAVLDTTAADAAGNQLKNKVEWKFLTVPKR